MKTLRQWGSIGIIVVGLIFFAIIRLTSFEEVDGVTMVASAQSNQHDAELVIGFGSLPPMGGPHNPVWQDCGVYASPVRPENAIHSMEHGADWITYHPDLAVDQVTYLQDLARDDSCLLLSPYPEQTSDIVLTVWDRQLVVDSPDDGRIKQFIASYRRTRGPESSASCQGGNGLPMQ
ncbi:MAG: DUF3105 domain-containing protein [Chloroflexi bacterium]|nr:DUF3105 domain-containing protein [Chloroflexota bacterium]